MKRGLYKAGAGLFIAVTLMFASVETGVTRASLSSVETSLNDKLRVVGPDPYDVLGLTRGTYLAGYGVVFTFEVNLVYSTGPNPFRPPMTREEIASLRDRKFRKLLILKDTMRRTMASAAALPGLAPNDHVVMEAFLLYYSWENQVGLPHRILMTSNRSNLLEAISRKADLGGVIQEQQQ
jgi:hypothetical protein